MPRILFPTGGLSTRYAVQNQPPFTTALALNVRPDDSLTGRERGGSRPGLSKDYILGATPTALGSGSAVTMASSVRYVGAVGPGKFIKDAFEGASTTPDSNYWDAQSTSAWDSDYDGNCTVDTTNDWLQNATPGTGNGKRGLLLISSGGSGEFIGTSDINWTAPVRLFASGGDTDATYGSGADRSFSFHLFCSTTTDGDPFKNSLTIVFRHIPYRYFSTYPYVTNTDVIFTEYVTSVGTVRWGGTNVLAVSPLDTVYNYHIDIKPLSVGTDGKILFSVSAGIDNLGINTPQVHTTVALAMTSRHRIGVSLTKGSTIISNPIPALSSFALQYTSLASTTLPPELCVFAAGGKIYRETTTLGTVALANSDGLGSANGIEYTETVSAVQRLGTLYMADYDVVTDQTATADPITLSTASPSILTHANITTLYAPDGFNDADLGLNSSIDRIDITSALDDAALGTYQFTIASDTTLSITGLDMSAGGTSAVKYRILCGPKKYNPSSDSISIWHDTVGDIPIGCTIVSTYADRMILTGDPLNPGVIFMSREGDPNDWDFSASNTDPQRAVGLGAADSDVGGLPEAVTAVIPHSDDYMIFGSKNTLWVLAGDPSIGGSLTNLSHSVGIVGRFAWCKTPENGLYFLSTNGLYYMPAGVETFPQPLSKGVIPQQLTGVDTAVVEPFLAYSLKEDGIYIFLAPKNNRLMSVWFVDAQTGGFFPYLYANSKHNPRSVYVYHPETISAPKIILGCQDGFVRRISESDTDDGTAISSSVLLGPIALGNPGGFLKSMRAQLAPGSGDVDWHLLKGESADNAAFFPESGTWSASEVSGENYYDRPNMRAAYAYINLQSTARWAMEYIDVERTTAKGHMPL